MAPLKASRIAMVEHTSAAIMQFSKLRLDIKNAFLENGAHPGLSANAMDRRLSSQMHMCVECERER